MSVTGVYIASRIRSSAIPYVRAYGEWVVRDVMTAFADLERRAEDEASAEFNRILSKPPGEDWDGDMSVYAETAEEKGQAFYDTMLALRQTTLNLFAVGLFHLMEQHLADLCRDGAFLVKAPRDTKLEVVVCWFRRHFEVDLTSLVAWPTMDELRHLANTVKHAEGTSARQLRRRRLELFQHPVLRQFATDSPDPTEAAPKLRLPLAGDDLYVTDEVFQEYSQACNQFLAEMVNYFEAHGGDYYPRGG